MTKLLQLVLLATALMAGLASSASAIVTDGGGPWPGGGHIASN